MQQVSRLARALKVVFQLLSRYSKVACLDSTHNTCFSTGNTEEKAFLYTIILKNLTTGKGSPAAFMLTPSEAQYPIIQWLRWLHTKFNFNPNCFMIDCSDTETAAIRVTFGAAMLIFECLWHVLKAIVDQAKKKLSVKTVPKGVGKVAANQRLREEAKKDFKRLVFATSAEDFDEIWAEIQVIYSEHEEWIRYLSREWMGKRERWSMSWRKASSGDRCQYFER